MYGTCPPTSPQFQRLVWFMYVTCAAMSLQLKLPPSVLDLDDGGQVLVAEHVAEEEPDAAADRGAEAVGADGEVGCPIASSESCAA